MEYWCLLVLLASKDESYVDSEELSLDCSKGWSMRLRRGETQQCQYKEYDLVDIDKNDKLNLISGMQF